MESKLILLFSAFKIQSLGALHTEDLSLRCRMVGKRLLEQFGRILDSNLDFKFSTIGVRPINSGTADKNGKNSKASTKFPGPVQGSWSAISGERPLIGSILIEAFS